MIPWKEVENNPQYQALPLVEQQKAKEQYFNEIVAPRVPAQDLELARTQFFGETAVTKEPMTIPPMAAVPKIPKDKGISLTDAALWAGRQALGAGETALSLTTGMLAWPISKVAGAARMVTAGAEEARKTEQELGEYLTWKPYTKEARGAVQLVGKGFEKLMWPAKKAGEIVEKATGSKELGYATEFGAELLTLKGIHAAGAKAKAKLKKPMPGEPGYITPKGRAEAVRKAELVERLKEAKPERPLAELKKAERKVRLVEEAKRGFITQPTKVIRRPAPEYYPRGAEYIAGKPTKAIVEYKPILNTRNLPYRSPQTAHTAIRQRGFDPKEYGIVEVKNGWAIQRKAKTLQEIKQAKIEKLPLGPRIIDEIKQPVDAAILAAKKGKPELVSRMAERARKNAETLRLADGPKVEKLISRELNRLPKEEQPSPSTQTLDFLGMQSMYEKALEKIRGIRKPKLIAKPTMPKGKVTLVEKPKELKPGETLKSRIDTLDEPLAGKELKEKFVRTKQGLSEEVLTPETVYRRDPEVGTKIYKAFELTQREKNKFLSTETDKFIKASRKIKKESVSASQVGRALDAKIKRSELKPEEAKLYDFLKDRYDFLIRFYARSRAGSEAAYKQVVSWVNQEYRPMARVESLSEYKQSRYNAMRKRLATVRGGKKKIELSGGKARQYRQIQNNMWDMLHKEWLDRLPEGQREAYIALSRRIKDYFTHIFDPEQLLADLKTELAILNRKLKRATHPAVITRHKKRLKKVEESITSLEGGKLITYEGLPKNIRFKYFEPRKGKEGYSFDAVKAYEAYLHGIARKIFDEPAVRMAAELHTKLDPSLRAYNKKFVRNWMGWERHKLDWLSGSIASFQWMRTLGVNPRSALLGTLQRINTIVEVGEKYSVKGYWFGYTAEGRRIFRKSGARREVGKMLMEGPVPEGMEKIRAIVGFLWNRMELGNRKHAVLSGYVKGRAKGMTEKEAINYGLDVNYKTQWPYGKLGMPMVFRRPGGRLIGQFSSYTIKQIELLAKWCREDPKKFIKFFMYTEAARIGVKKFLDTDISHYAGFGITWGEVMNALKDMSEGDWRGFWRHLKLSVSGGGGLLPSGLGPTATGAIKVAQAVTKGRGLEQLKKELTPVQVKRFVDLYKSVVGERKNQYPVYDRKGRVMYYLTAPQLVRRTIGPRTAKESKEWLKYQKETLLEQERREVLDDIKKAIVDGDTQKARALVKKYKVYPTFDSIVTEKLRRKYPREKVEQLRRKGRIGKREEYQFQREGEILR